MTPTQTTAAPDPRREEELRIQALGAALSRRKWSEVEEAYDKICDEFYRRPRAMQEAMSAQGGGEAFNPLDEVMQQELRGRAADMLKAHGWKAGDRLHLMGQIGNMVEFAIDVLRKPPARCDYPGCGCDHDAHCNVSLARPAPEVKDAPVSTSGLGLPSWWKPSPLLGKALDAYRKIKCDYERDDGDRRGIAHALLKAEFGIVEAIFHDHDEDAEVYQNAPVVELMVDLIDRLTNLRSSSLSLTRPAPEVNDAAEAKRPEDMSEDELIATLKPLSPAGLVKPPTPAPAAASEGLVERLRDLGVRSASLAAARIEADAAEKAKLSDPNAVHINMLRGIIAKPTWEQIKHLYPEATAAEAERDALMEALEGACAQILDSYRTWVADDIEAHPKPGQIPRYDHARATLRREAKGGREDVG